jgi:hypothetical protein
MHVMVDIETLGTRSGSVVVSIGAVQFSDAGFGASFYRSIDVFDSLMHGLVIDPETVEWWRKQSPETRGAVMAEPHRLRDALHAFARFIDRGPSWCDLWAKGPDFDLVLMEAAYEAAGMKKPWAYRNARDVRTLLALVPDIGQTQINPAKHNALRDAEYQADQVIRAYERLGLKLGEPE